jgi:YHS domain-containing protein
MTFNSNQITTAVDPVCGIVVDQQLGPLVFKYKDSLFYFCAEGCRAKFEQNPTKYLADKTIEPKGFWKRYLERLNKATGGKPPQCCQ